MSLAALTTLAAAGGCTHTQAPPMEAPAKAAVNETRGLCPTDLNQTRAALQKRDDGYALIFETDDESQIIVLQERVKALGEAIAGPHQAINAKGELIEHPGVPSTPELLEQPVASPGRGVQLLIKAPEDQRAALKADLEDHLRLWLNGECPELKGTTLRASAGTTDPRQQTDR
jgi:hypothetical protein